MRVRTCLYVNRQMKMYMGSHHVEASKDHCNQYPVPSQNTKVMSVSTKPYAMFQKLNLHIMAYEGIDRCIFYF